MNEELNRKLAEWAGFEYSHKARVKNFFTGVLGRMVKFWVHPDGYVGELPNFTESLDACFKWLVPKPPSYNPDVRLIQSITFDCGTCSILDVMGDEYVGDDQVPATALCLAIEKLIDKEEPNEGDKNPTPTT